MSDDTGSTIDHLNITATDIAASKAFDDAVLPVIGIDRLLDLRGRATGRGAPARAPVVPAHGGPTGKRSPR